MVFSSAVFLFIFLPLVLFINIILKERYRNPFVLIASLFFYAWGEHMLVLLMVSSICINYLVGITISYYHQKDNKRGAVYILALGILINLSILFYFKYTYFIIENLELLGSSFEFEIDLIVLPIGVSFFTFQNISYLIDVYRKEVESQKNLFHLGLYVSLFPQLIAGPIVRYVDIQKEIQKRIITKELFLSGLTRFIRGLGKKVLIANTAGLIADNIFSFRPDTISSGIAWLGIICYALQIYFDFSGYSDMAIGLGRMLGFNFKENFNYPYISKSIQDFWRRWHISLSTWFRDYLYIPLGGNRKGKNRTYINLVIVFFITGLWHGASWNFIVWGLYHGFFLLVERVNPFQLPRRMRFLSHVYLIVVVLVGWVFFRAENLPYAIDYIYQMFAFQEGVNFTSLLYVNTYTCSVILFGFLLATPIRKKIKNVLIERVALGKAIFFVRYVIYGILFFFSILELAQATYNPFIYYRF